MQQPPFTLAHRGHSERFPENTMAAFEAALEHSLAIEFDVHATSDDVLVCTHDRTLERLHGDPRAVRELISDELAAIAPEIPRLEEVLSVIGPRACLFVELKEPTRDTERALMTHLRASGLSIATRTAVQAGHFPGPGSVVVETNRVRSLGRLRRAERDLGVLYVVRSDRRWQTIARAGGLALLAHGLVIPDRLATRRLLWWLRRARKSSYVYTVNCVDRYGALQALGVHGVFTDAPDRVRPAEDTGVA